ncbi:MAG: hypothetical protein ACJ72J_14590 [Nitrososphaeraceae archaeon]
MNLKLISIFLLAFANIISVPLIAYAVSQYDSEGFTILPTKSDWYMIGYREGVVKAWQDVQLMDQHKIATIDANQDHVVCSKDMVNPEECLGYKDGYSDEAMDQLE